ncbi:MAG: 50S ribosomal protein L10 [Thermodesulfobacteriota bacterium]
MDKSEKVTLVADLKDKFSRADAMFVAEYQGIKASDMDGIRKGLRDASVDFKVVRNTLARRAIAGTELESIGETLKGPTALIFSYEDAAAAAKVITRFSKEHPKLKLLLGALGNKVIGLDEIKGLAELPPRDVLLGKLLGSLNSPVTGFVMVLSGVPRKLLFALNAIKDAKAAAAPVQ